ncbi:MAG: sulfite exporter TauE/SafE family protein [Fusobacteriaceae bacterium]
MELSLATFLGLGITCFIAAFIDSIAGGGGMISVPAYMAAGIPPHMALGTNKMSASFAATSSAWKFWKAGRTTPSIWKFLVPFTLVGAVLGSYAVMLLDKKYLYPLVVVMLIITICYTVYHKNLGNVNYYEGFHTRQQLIFGMMFAFILGFYDGFFGPGTGSFLIFCFIKVFKFDFIFASGNAKILNLVSSIFSLLTFMYLGQVLYLYGMGIGLFSFVGGYYGSKFAILRGSQIIKPIFLLASSAVLLKMAYQNIDLKALFNF